MKRIFKLFSWLLFLTGFGLTSFASYQIYIQKNGQKGSPFLGGTILSNFATHLKEPQEKIVVETVDGRTQALAEFIKRYNPDLLEKESDFHETLVKIADKHQLDFKLLPAIAMKESGFCKNIPKESYNCLGLGIHSKGTWTFDSYEENFDTAARILKKNYIDRGLITPEQIMTRYTPHSPNGEWARGVNQFMSEIKYNDRQKGREANETNNVVASPTQIKTQ